MDDPMLGAIGYTANATAQAFALLVKCLKENGSLKDGQFEAELRATIERAAEVERSRLDYEQLRVLLELLEGSLPEAH